MFIIPFSIVQISIILINILSVWLLFLVSSRALNHRTVSMFGMMIILMLIWVNFAFLSRITPPEIGIVFIKLAWSITPFFFALIYFFIKQVFDPRRKFNLFEKILLVLGILNFPFIFFTSSVIKEIWFTEKILNISYGGLEWLFFFEVFFLSVLIIYSLVNQLRKKIGKNEKAKVGYLLIGFLFFLIMNTIFNIIFPVFLQKFSFYSFGDYSTIVFLSFIAYAIIKKELFDIKVVLTSVFVVLIALILGLDALVLTDVFWVQIVKGIALFIFLVFGWQLVKSIIREIDQRKKLEDAYDKLQQLDQAKSEFMSIVSHQLRTPLSIIKGHLSMVDEGVYDKNPRKRRKVLRDVYKANERLINLVNDVLSASRIQSGKIEVVRRESNVIDIVGGVVERFKKNAEEKGVKLRFKSPKDPVLANIDYSKIENCFLNLLDNAIKYTSKGSVEISIKDEVDYFEIKIKDTGDGMTKQEINKLFKTFSRGSAGKRYWVQGSGLGLYIARQFAEMHGGKVWATSKGEDQGSSFYIKIPKQNDLT